MPPSCALLGGFAIGARVALLWCEGHKATRKLSAELKQYKFVSKGNRVQRRCQTLCSELEKKLNCYIFA